MEAVADAPGAGRGGAVGGGAAGLRRDRLEYRRQQVDEGLLDPAELWPAAEASTQAEQAYESARDALEARTETVARRYGGREWERLKLLLVEHLRAERALTAIGRGANVLVQGRAGASASPPCSSTCTPGCWPTGAGPCGCLRGRPRRCC
ncbi:MAG: hypothetical protein U5L11_01050 [Arhodomonas sp.]|nr:hypothetical protein [Arhodomonas sp.]